jgi:hypothetical protein
LSHTEFYQVEGAPGPSLLLGTGGRNRSGWRAQSGGCQPLPQAVHSDSVSTVPCFHPRPPKARDRGHPQRGWEGSLGPGPPALSAPMVIVNGGLAVCEYAMPVTPSITSPSRVLMDPLIPRGRSPAAPERKEPLALEASSADYFSSAGGASGPTTVMVMILDLTSTWSL